MSKGQCTAGFQPEEQAINKHSLYGVQHFILLLNIYLFIWLHQVLIVAHRIFIVAGRIFNFNRPTLSCGIWDLVPWPGIEPGSPALGVQSLSHWSTREVPLMAPFNLITSLKALSSNTVTYWGTRGSGVNIWLVVGGRQWSPLESCCNLWLFFFISSLNRLYSWLH